MSDNLSRTDLRYDNAVLSEQNEKLRAENERLREIEKAARALCNATDNAERSAALGDLYNTLAGVRAVKP